MVDFATLVLTADSRGLVAGDQALDNFGDTAERTGNRADRALTVIDKATERVGKQSIFAAQNSRMMAMQLSQVAQQASVTGNWLQAIAIQLPDLALGFGPIGIAAGAAAGAILAYFASYAGGDDANDILRDQEDLIRRVAERWGEAYPAIQRYNDEIERTREQADLLAAIDIIKADKLKDVAGIIEELRVNLADFESQLNASGEEPAVIMAFRDALESAIEKLELGQDATGDLQRATNILGNDIENTANPAIASMIDMLGQLAKASQQTAQAVANVVNSAAAVQSQIQNTIQNASFRDADGTIRTPGQFTPFNPVTPDSRPLIELDGLPGEFGRKGRKGRKGGKSQAQLYDDIVAAANRRITSLEAEKNAIGLTDEAAAKLLYTTDLFNDAQQKGINLSGPQREQLTTLAETMARVEEETRQASEAMEFQKDVLHGIFGDLRNALDDGKITMEEFGDIAIGVLDKVIDKLQGDWVDAIANMWAGSGGSSILDFFGLGSGSKSTDPWAGMRVASFDGGGYTGTRSRSGGMDGKGGFMALLHPDESVIDHARGQSGGGQKVDVTSDVRVSVDNNGNLRAFVERTSARTSGEMITQFSREALPGRVNEISRDPRAVG